jgi:Ca-activated chloride channel family protein
MRLFFVLALALGALALFLSEKNVRGQIPGGNNMAPPGSTAKPSPTPAAQATPEPTPPDDVDDADVVRVSSTLVVVPVSVTDSTGQPVPGLTVPDFRLDEAGKTQEIAQIGNPEQVPLDIALLIDVSSSVSKKFDFELQAATRFLKEVMKTGDRAAIFAIEMEPRLAQPLGSAETASAALLTLKAPTTAVPTPFYDAVRNAAHYLAENTPANHHRVVVVVSDGEDNFSRDIKDTEIAVYQNQTGTANNSTQDRQARSAQLEKQRQTLHTRAQNEVLGEVQKADVTFYSINPTGSAVWLNGPGVRAQKGMELVSEGTGGTAFLPNKVEDLDQVFRQIIAELRAQYLVQYYSSDETSPNGSFLPIKVHVPQRPELKVRARSGYYVKRK